MNQPRALILSIALGATLLSSPALAQEFFQPGTVPASDLLAPPASSVLQQGAAPVFDATAYSSRNTSGGTSASDQGYAFLTPEEAAILAAQAVGEPVTLAGVSGVVLTPTADPAAPHAPDARHDGHSLDRDSAQRLWNRLACDFFWVEAAKLNESI